MPYRTLIEPSQLEGHLGDPDWVVVDCRFSLAEPDRGRASYDQSHIPGAVYAHLDEDLSSPVVPGRTGRHPLPDPEAMAARLGEWGIGPGVQVVAYDDSKGGIAVRLWWILGWLGHDDVAVLNGGWPAWEAQGLPTRAGQEPPPAPRRFVAAPRPERTATVADVAAAGGDPGTALIDARAAPRYRGEEEPIDPVAGHIPGAVSAPWADNVDAEGRFRSPDELRARFAPLLEGREPGRAICYCGSGVTANHDVLAMVHAGLARPRLYPGSWSEWITDPSRPVATGDE